MSRLAVETPVKLSPAAEGAAEGIRDRESQTGTHPEAEGFMARLKEFWKGDA